MDYEDSAITIMPVDIGGDVYGKWSHIWPRLSSRPVEQDGCSWLLGGRREGCVCAWRTSSLSPPSASSGSEPSMVLERTSRRCEDGNGHINNLALPLLCVSFVPASKKGCMVAIVVLVWHR